MIFIGFIFIIKAEIAIYLKKSIQEAVLVINSHIVKVMI